MRKIPYLSFIFLIWTVACNRPDPGRTFLSLDGQWEVGESLDSLPPRNFSSTITVPGLMDLALPQFDSSGYRSTDRNYFWYRKEVGIPDGNFEFARLKVHKAKFGHSVFVNGQFAGRYDYCFTPGYFEIGPYLNRDSMNVILIRVGAHPGVLPDSIPYGYDIEKSLYYPGIYDRVELLMGRYPMIREIQVVPDIENEIVTIFAWLEHKAGREKYNLYYEVKEKNRGMVVARGRAKGNLETDRYGDPFKLEIEIPDCRLWSPDDPFLYELTLRSEGDSREVTFGMREFRFDPDSKMAMLNGKQIYLRGTNVALHRFFEDPDRKGLPWDRSWVTGLHDLFGEMHWNSYRFHVGFAPEEWYQIADEKGFLVQDEYPLWGAWSDDQKKRHRASVLAREYSAWMRERWNHPSVVIWDAQNETVTSETGIAISMVRHLDRSDRPWDNGYSAPQDLGDVIESHPYLFAHPNQGTFAIQPPWDYDPDLVFAHLPKGGLLHNELSIKPDLFNDANNKDPSPDGSPYPNPYIVNEYGWIWLYRNGTPAWAAEELWKYYPELDTPEKRWEWRGRVVAALTEYWRSRREIAGVQHFCILTCDRPQIPKSQVSDEWADVEKLVLQPGFRTYVASSFAPVGIMIKRWENRFSGGDTIHIPVVVFNDLHDPWKGEVTLSLAKGTERLHEQRQTLETAGMGSSEVIFMVAIPEVASEYELTAELELEGERIFSSRLFQVGQDHPSTPHAGMSGN